MLSLAKISACMEDLPYSPCVCNGWSVSGAALDWPPLEMLCSKVLMLIIDCAGRQALISTTVALLLMTQAGIFKMLNLSYSHTLAILTIWFLNNILPCFSLQTTYITDTCWAPSWPPGDELQAVAIDSKEQALIHLDLLRSRAWTQLLWADTASWQCLLHPASQGSRCLSNLKGLGSRETYPAGEIKGFPAKQPSQTPFTCIRP